jgi:hypothetical protein
MHESVIGWRLYLVDSSFGPALFGMAAFTLPQGPE